VSFGSVARGGGPGPFLADEIVLAVAEEVEVEKRLLPGLLGDGPPLMAVRGVVLILKAVVGGSGSGREEEPPAAEACIELKRLMGDVEPLTAGAEAPLRRLRIPGVERTPVTNS
jgi:hypothetical protein